MRAIAKALRHPVKDDFFRPLDGDVTVIIRIDTACRPLAGAVPLGDRAAGCRNMRLTAIEAGVKEVTRVRQRVRRRRRKGLQPKGSALAAERHAVCRHELQMPLRPSGIRPFQRLCRLDVKVGVRHDADRSAEDGKRPRRKHRGRRLQTRRIKVPCGGTRRARVEGDPPGLVLCGGKRQIAAIFERCQRRRRLHIKS